MLQTPKANYSNLLILSTPAAVVVMTFLLSGGNALAAIGTGITSLASSAAVVSNLDRRCGYVKNAKELIRKLPSLETETQSLIAQCEQLKKTLERQESETNNYREQLNYTQGTLSQKQGKLAEIKQELITLSENRAELESRVALIKQQNPELTYLEKLQKQIEKIKVEASGLEGQKEQLTHQINSLEIQKKELQKIETQLSNKEIELKQLQVDYESLSVNKNNLEKFLEKLRSQNNELELQKQQTIQAIAHSKLEQTAELELLRVTYDTLSSEKDSFETRINHLRPEISGLEAQKQQILQAIQQSEEKYRQIEQQRQESHRLRLEIKQRQQDISNLEREARQVTGIIAASEEEKAQLEQSNHKLEQRLKQLKGEIEAIENSAALALQALRKPLWIDFPQASRQIDTTPTGEQQFILGFTQYLTQRGLSFPQRVINAFHTSLKVQDISALVILAGISGTGKSELPQRYAEYIGAQKLTLAVQPRWDSPQDLQGFYNYIEKKYKPTDLMRGLYQYQNDPENMRDRLVIVLLDEMNLARVEYYFSDFLSKLESRRSQATYLDLDVGSLPLPETERKLAIPQQFLFVGTMNEDETTQSLSDKVLDRANVLTFGKPQQLKLREEANSDTSAPSVTSYVSYSQFKGWMRSPVPNSDVVTKLRDYLDRANNIMDKLGHPFAHRVYQAIIRYVVNYPGVVQGNELAFNAALADQFGQKLLPKLRGLMLDECDKELNEFSQLINEINDEALIKAFAAARNGHFGQFQWRGFVYLEELEPVSNLVGGKK